MKRINHLTKTAYHEAGHAVVSFFLQVGVQIITIVPTKHSPTLASWGHIKNYTLPNFNPDLSSSPEVEKEIEKQIMILFAGNEAEKKLTGRYNYLMSTRDYQKIGKLSSYLTPGGKVETYFLKYLREKTKNIINLRWPSVDKLAKYLLTKKNLKGKECDDCLRSICLPTFVSKKSQ